MNIKEHFLAKGKDVTTGKWLQGFVSYMPTTERCSVEYWFIEKSVCDKDFEVDPESICGFTGVKIRENTVTDENSGLKEPTKIFDNDLIAIYEIHYDDDDNPIREQVAIVQAKYDDLYHFTFAECVSGTMIDIEEKCDISYLDTNYDIPFSYFVETMENSSSQWWEWECIGNAFDNPNS